MTYSQARKATAKVSDGYQDACKKDSQACKNKRSNICRTATSVHVHHGLQQLAMLEKKHRKKQERGFTQDINQKAGKNTASWDWQLLQNLWPVNQTGRHSRMRSSNNKAQCEDTLGQAQIQEHMGIRSYRVFRLHSTERRHSWPGTDSGAHENTELQAF
eukprot:1147994-Pelagomonas_calceolata.AAC.3